MVDGVEHGLCRIALSAAAFRDVATDRDGERRIWAVRPKRSL
jgi:hypothetical protein